MTDKLRLYNRALLFCSERPLVTLTDDVARRYILDTVFDNGFVDEVLEEGYWHFAMKSGQLDYDPSIEPAFGATRAFVLPDDLVKIYGVFSNEYMRDALDEYQIEDNTIYCDLDIIYVRYVSNAADMGGDLSKWTQRFMTAAARRLAEYAANGFNKAATDIEAKRKLAGDAFSDARSFEAMKLPTRYLPAGRWVRARHGYSGNRSDRHGGPSRSF